MKSKKLLAKYHLYLRLAIIAMTFGIILSPFAIIWAKTFVIGGLFSVVGMLVFAISAFVFKQKSDEYLLQGLIEYAVEELLIMSESDKVPNEETPKETE